MSPTSKRWLVTEQYPKGLGPFKDHRLGVSDDYAGLLHARQGIFVVLTFAGTDGVCSDKDLYIGCLQLHRGLQYTDVRFHPR